MASGEVLAEGLQETTAAVVYGAGLIAAQLDARMIVVASRGGAAAIASSERRNYVPTVGISDNPATLRAMCLFWGVIPLADAPLSNSSELLEFVATGARTKARSSPATAWSWSPASAWPPITQHAGRASGRIGGGRGAEVV